MEKVGRVVSVDGKFAEVKVGRHNDCKSCGACPAANSQMILKMRNPVKAKEGQLIQFSTAEDKMVWAAFTVYLLPLLAGGVGFVLALYAFPASGEMAGYWGAGILFVLSLFYIRYKNKKVSGEEALLPVIEKIIDE